MKLIFLFALITSAFAQEDLSKAFGKRTEKDCTRILSEIRKYSREKAGLLDKIEKVEIGKNKDSTYALLYLKLKSGEICAEQPSRTNLNTMFVQYTCRDKNGKPGLEKNIDAGYSDCQGDAPKHQ